MVAAKIRAGTPAHADPLEQVHRRFEGWRRTRERLSPIPEALWASAVGLAREHGLHKTAGALRLNYYTLKKHLESADGQAGGQEVKATVVELAPRAAAMCEFIFELENARGAKMRIEFKGTDTPDLAILSRVFLNIAS
ncbi:MAG: hypothetical protein ACRD1L_12065 [Terriglobales bacterium]